MLCPRENFGILRSDKVGTLDRHKAVQTKCESVHVCRRFSSAASMTVLGLAAHWFGLLAPETALILVAKAENSATC